MTAVLEPSPMELSVPDQVRTLDLIDDVLTEDVLTDDELTDDELTAQALAADLDGPIDADAPPWSPTSTGLMPEWYMPASLPRHRGGWRAWLAVAVVVGLVAINAAGLCITYGHLVIA